MRNSFLTGRAAAERKLGQEQYQGFSPGPFEPKVLCLECCCYQCSLCQIARAIKGYEKAKASGMVTTTTTTVTSQPPGYEAPGQGQSSGKAGALAI